MNEWSVVWGIGMVAVAVVAVAMAIYLSRGRHVTLQSDSAWAEMSRRLDELTLQVVELKLALSYSQVENASLRAQVVELGGTPVVQPARIHQIMGEDPLVHIYRLITEHFGMSEMDELAAMAGIPPESYSGDTRASRALSLVQYAARLGILKDLLMAARRIRPRVKWPMVQI